jgi:hypothetical protein
MNENEKCPHCTENGIDGHEHPLTHPWAVYVDERRDADGQPIYLVLCKTGMQHVAESDAEFFRQLICNAERPNKGQGEK